jgi:hypothetical protein
MYCLPFSTPFYVFVLIVFPSLRCNKSASTLIHLLSFGFWTDIKIENIHRQPQNRASIRNIHNSRNVPFDGNTAQHQIDLIIAVSKSAQILNHPNTALSIRNRGVHIVLFAMLVDAEAFEVDHSSRGELGLDWTGDVNRRFASFHSQGFLAVFDHGEFDRDDAGDFDGPAEGDFAVAL